MPGMSVGHHDVLVLGACVARLSTGLYLRRLERVVGIIDPLPRPGGGSSRGSGQSRWRTRSRSATIFPAHPPVVENSDDQETLEARACHSPEHRGGKSHVIHR